MTQVSVKIDDAYLRDVVAELQLAPGAIKRLRRNAAWDTAKQTKTHTSKLIRDKVAIKKKDLDPHLGASRVGEGAKVTLKESKRLPLREFGATVSKKRGVSYRIEKGGPRKRIPDAFEVKKFGGHIFRRVGKARLPIRKLMAISSWGVVVKNDMVQPIAEKAEENLEKNIARRVNLEVLRRTGKVKT